MATVLANILPVFALILAGFGFGRTRLLGRAGALGMGVFVYYLAIPALLFRGMTGEAPAPTHESLGVLGAYFAGSLVVFGLAMPLGKIAFRLSLAEQGLMALTASFSNSVQLGIPIVLAVYGPAGLAPLTLIISIHSIVLLSLATLVIELGLGAQTGWRQMLRSTALAIATNPVIVAIAIGFLWHRAGLAVPAVLGRFIDLLAGAASPAALFALGATIAGFRLAGDLHQSLVVVALKLLVLPLAVWLLATRVFHLDTLDTAVVTVCAALPSGSNPFILAQRYNLYVQRAASTVLISTVLAILTLSALLALYPP